MGIRYSLYLNLFVDWRALYCGGTFAFLREDNILFWQMHKQSRLQGHASLETQAGYTDGHVTVRNSLNHDQGVKITPTGGQPRDLRLPRRASF